MGTVYRKSPKGVIEIETRAHRLTPRVRSVLIMVDGRRGDDELRAVIPQQVDESLQFLLDNGFIEVAGAVESPPQGGTRPATAESGLRASATPAAAPLAPARPPSLDITRVRREAERALTEQLGPMAESLALKMERARDAGELRPLLESAVQLIANVRGAQAAAAFKTRFLADAP